MTDAEPDRLVEKLDLAQKVRLLTGATVWRAPAEPAVELRELVFSDGPAGVRGQGWDERDTSLALPAPTALGATWDGDLVHRLGVLLAAEARRKAVDVVLAPTLNLHRTPVAGRHFECFAEDPLLTGRIGAALVRGVQSGGVAATAKHYVANDSETGRTTLDARVGERVLREVYLAPFELAVQAGVWVVMSAYNGVNGAPMPQNPLLAEPLKGEWAFDGPVVSDWGAVRSTAPSGRAGQDLVMPGPDGPWGATLVEAVRAGEVSEEAVDDKVRRLLVLASKLGALGSVDRPVRSTVEPTDARALLRVAVSASTVLLRNENSLLPLDPARLRRVAVIGPNAVSVRVQGGGSAGVYPSSVVSPLEGIRAALAETAEVGYAPGARPDTGPVALDTTTARNPRTGEPGVLVRVFDADGAEILAEHRLTGRVLEPAEPVGARAVEVSALLRPGVSGTWRISLAGWGAVSLAVDGVPVLADDIVRDTDDPAAVHLAPPHRSVEVELTEGMEVLLAARRAIGNGSGRAVELAADPPRRPEDEELAAAVELARGADAAVVVVGTTALDEREGFDRMSLCLPGRQDDLVRAVRAVNPATVVVVNSGGPVLLPWRDEVPAVLLTWFPGQEAGHGLADVLFGAAEPGGRLPTTWAAERADLPVPDAVPVDGVLDYAEGLHVGHRGWLATGRTPAYWFGHGLGYTTWSYESIDAADIVAGEPIEVRVRVRNTGARAGREVVQVYLSRPDTALDRPARWLAGFAAVTAEPGEEVEAAVLLAPRAVQHWSVEQQTWCTEPGAFTVSAGPSAGDQRQAVVITV